MVTVYCKNTGTKKEFVEGLTLQEILKGFEFEQPYDILAAKVNNVTTSLKFRIFNSRDVEFLDFRAYAGRNVYSSSLCFLAAKAAEDVFPGCRLVMHRPISKGFFCTLEKAPGQRVEKASNQNEEKAPGQSREGAAFQTEGKASCQREDAAFQTEQETSCLCTEADVAAISARMREIVEKNLSIRRHEVQQEEAIEMFRKKGCEDKVRLLETTDMVYVTFYTIGDSVDYYCYPLVPSTGYLKVWDLSLYKGGLLLRLPDRHEPGQLAPFFEQPKTYEIFNEMNRWNGIMELGSVGDLNKACQNGRATELIQIAEALQEKKIVRIAEDISHKVNGTGVRVVLITGPTSSGKSTFCKKLSVQLKACGLKPVSFSTDDYFVDRVKTPKLPDGSYDFDNFDTVDHDALQQDVLKLLRGETVQVPEFNFVTGIREYNGKTLQLKENSILLIEGIHALNPMLTNLVPSEKKYKIFINTITSLSLDDHNCIPTSDYRLLRRIVRDSNNGSFTATQTISNWPNVRRAEVKWIYPFQEEADVLFNSSYLVEFAVLRSHAERILSTVRKNTPQYSEANRLLMFLNYFVPVSDRHVPATSILRGVIGGGSL